MHRKNTAITDKGIRQRNTDWIPGIEIGSRTAKRLAEMSLPTMSNPKPVRPIVESLHIPSLLQNNDESRLPRPHSDRQQVVDLSRYPGQVCGVGQNSCYNAVLISYLIGG